MAVGVLTRPRALRPLRRRGYRLLVGSVAASLTATGMWLVAVTWQVIDLGGGPSDLSVTAAAYSAGLLAAVLLGGLAADRRSKRAVLISAEAVRVATALAVGVLSLTGSLRMWQLAVAAVLVGAAEAFYYPAYSALVPVLLPAEELLAANGVEAALRPAAERAVGPAIAGGVVAAFSPGLAVLTAAAGWLLALLPLLGLRVPAGSSPDGSGRGSVLRGLAEGFGFLFRTRWLAATLCYASAWALTVLGPVEVLLPFAVRDRVGGGPSAYALVLASFGLASALGSLAVASWRLPRRYLTTLLLLWGSGITPLAAFGLTEHVAVMVVAAAVVGFTDAIAMVIWGTLLQRRVPPHLLGRVSSLDFFVSLTLMPVSMALAGPVGETIGLTAAFVVAAAVPAVAAPLTILVWRLHRDEVAHPLDRTEDTDRAPAATAGS